VKKIVIVLALGVLAYSLATHKGPLADHSAPGLRAANPASQSASAESDDALGRAYAQHLSNVQVESSGVVERVLSDDNDGSRHQRIIVRLGSGQTLLIAHNAGWIRYAGRVYQ
jgi:Protein of unknown function (DUF3465)